MDGRGGGWWWYYYYTFALIVYLVTYLLTEVQTNLWERGGGIQYILPSRKQKTKTSGQIFAQRVDQTALLISCGILLIRNPIQNLSTWFYSSVILSFFLLNLVLFMCWQIFHDIEIIMEQLKVKVNWVTFVVLLLLVLGRASFSGVF